MRESERYSDKVYRGRNRRLLYEWRLLEERLENRRDILCRVAKRNAEGLPIAYIVNYQIRSICGVEQLECFGEPGVVNKPIFANDFQMRIELPDGYPSIDAQAEFRFVINDEAGQSIPHPWHPNIRYFGDFAGRVCLNMNDSYTDLVWGVERIADYLRYDVYHAVSEPPYPEDLKVASWVIRQGEPNEWIYFDQKQDIES